MTLIAIYYTQIVWGSILVCAIAMSLALWATAIKKDALANILLGIALVALVVSHLVLWKGVFSTLSNAINIKENNK